MEPIDNVFNMDGLPYVPPSQEEVSASSEFVVFDERPRFSEEAVRVVNRFAEDVAEGNFMWITCVGRTVDGKKVEFSYVPPDYLDDAHATFDALLRGILVQYIQQEEYDNSYFEEGEDSEDS